MPSAVAGHRPTTKVGNKPFKSRKATKGAIRTLAKGIFTSAKQPACLVLLILENLKPLL